MTAHSADLQKFPEQIINIINENCIIFQLRFLNCVRDDKKIIHIPLPARINRGTQVTQRDTALAVSMDTHYVVSRESLTQTHGHTGRPPQQRISRKRKISRDPGAELDTPGYVGYESGPGKKKGSQKMERPRHLHN